MSRDFKYHRKYYDDRQIFKKASISIEPGVTVFIGCNGSGKSTLSLIIKDYLRKNKIPLYEFDNYHYGGSHSMSESLFKGDMSMVAEMASASEGERITLNIGNKFRDIINFLSTGKTRRDILIESFSDEDSEENKSKERWIILDALDSGYSIDNIIDFKDYILNLILEKSEQLNVETYIIITSNDYEMCIDLPCFNVTDGKYVDINSYEDFKKEILKTRAFKDKMIDKYYKEII